MFKINNVKFLIGRGTLYVQKYSPEILTVLGVAGGTATVVMAAKAAIKAQPLVNDLRSDVANIHDLHNNYPENQGNSRGKDLARIHIRHGYKIVKVYSPTITLGLLSATSILTAHGIMRRRNFALVAVAKSLESSYNEFQKRVALEIGDERALELARGIETETYKDKDGKKQTRKIYNPETTDLGEYQRVFDRENGNYQVDPNYNETFLRSQERYANDLLVARGHVLLNDVFDELGFPRTPAGAITGWVYDPKADDIDNFIDFGIHQLTLPESQLRYADGVIYEDIFLLDFNVDGTVWDKIR